MKAERMTKRRKARELALQVLYGFEVSGNAVDVVCDEIASRTDDEQIAGFASELFHKSIRHKESLDAHVASVVENWDFGRIAMIDRLILRLALCELLHFDEIPPKVTINEAIDLAKKFSTAQSGRFVNGILDSLFRKLLSENKIVKKGRGLVNTSMLP